MTLLGCAGGAGTSTGGVNAAGGGAFQSTQSAFQRHKPYFKQGSTGPSGSSSVAAGGVERRSSWASSSAAGGSAALAINAQQQAQLERIYRQSIGQQVGRKLFGNEIESYFIRRMPLPQPALQIRQSMPRLPPCPVFNNCNWNSKNFVQVQRTIPQGLEVESTLRRVHLLRGKIHKMGKTIFMHFTIGLNIFQIQY
jgi:hypothetical protein